MIAACPPEQRLREFSLGKLNEKQSDLVFSHVSDCLDCQQVLSQENTSDDSLVAQLSLQRTQNDFALEAECQTAMNRASIAMTQAPGSDEFPEQKLLGKKLGDYEVERLIGCGGMGNVYLARHAKLGRQVALKVIAGHRSLDPRMQGRFESEMQAVGQLHHPNIVNALDAREVDGVAILVTEWIDGLDLGEIVRRTGPLSAADAAQVTLHVARALSAIDDAGLVHRDIKPSNIMINTKGEVKLLDLGLTRLQCDDAAVDLTVTGQAVGTADYLSPEQIKGQPVDIRTDVYGLGCTLFRLLTGKVPFGGSAFATSFAKMNAHVSSEPPTIEFPGMSKSLVSLTRRMMAKDIARRPDLAEIQSAFEEYGRSSDLKTLVQIASAAAPNQYAQGHKESALKSGSGTLPWWRRRVPLAVAMASGLVGILLGLAMGVIITIKKPDGTTATLEVPDGSRVTIDEQGNAEVELGQQPIMQSSNLQPSEDVWSKLIGVWRVQMTDADGTAIDDAFGPNLAVFGGLGSMAFFNDHEIMAQGATAMDVKTQSLTFHFQPPDGMSISPGSVFWLPPVLQGNVVFANDGVLLTQMKRLRKLEDDSARGSVHQELGAIGMQIKLSRPQEFAGNRVADYLALARTNRKLRAALLHLVTLEMGGQLTKDEQTQVRRQMNRIQSRDNLGRLAVAIHNYHDLNKHLPASQITKDGSAQYSSVVSHVADGQIVALNSKRPDTVTVNLGTADNLRLKQRFVVYRQDSRDFRTGHGKAIVEISRILDDHLAEARIVSKEGDRTTPQARDFVVSISESKKTPIAIAGTIDLNGDGSTDIQRLISIIEQSGFGEVVAYHDIAGNVFGEIDGDTRMFVVGNEPQGDTLYSFKKLMRQQENFKTRTVSVEALLNEIGYRNETKIERYVEDIHAESFGMTDTRVTKKESEIHPYSWRVAILPFIGHQRLYDQYRFDEKWDSDHNSKLIQRMPDVFRYPGDPADTWATRYHGISGPAGAIGVNQGIQLEEIHDGSSNTIMLVEARTAVPWTQPNDIYFDPLDPFQPKLEWLMDGICNVAFADATVRSMNVVTDRAYPGSKVLAGLFTINGGENLGPYNTEIFDLRKIGEILDTGPKN